LKKPDDFIGFVELNGLQCSFIFEERTLRVFPSSKDQWEDDKNDLEQFFSSFNDSAPAWIPRKDIHGVLHTGQKIMFCVWDNPGWIDGFQSYEVNWLVVYAREPVSEIAGLRIYGDEINDYFPPSKTFSAAISEDPETRLITSMSVSGDIYEQEWGECQFDGYSATVKWNAYPTVHYQTSTPFTAKSLIAVDFLSPQQLDNVWNCYYTFRRFLSYVVYRRNVMPLDVDLVKITPEGQREACGKIAVISTDPSSKEEGHKDRGDRIIKASVLGINAKHLLPFLSSNEIYFEHFCASIDGVGKYSTARAILIFAAFEREFRSLYGQDYQRSEAFLETKKTVVQKIDEIVQATSGKERKYTKGFKGAIEKMDSSLEDKICAATRDCQEIMQPFICREYHTQDFTEVIDAAKRLNGIRNDIAHGNLEFELEPVNLRDYKILEYLLYAMRLKRTVCLEPKNIQKAISDLFGLHLIH